MTLYLQTVEYECKICKRVHKIEEEIFYKHYEANFPPARRLGDDEVREIFGTMSKEKQLTSIGWRYYETYKGWKVYRRGGGTFIYSALNNDEELLPINFTVGNRSEIRRLIRMTEHRRKLNQ